MEEDDLYGEGILIEFDRETKRKEVELVEMEDFNDKKSKFLVGSDKDQHQESTCLFGPHVF